MLRDQYEEEVTTSKNQGNTMSTVLAADTSGYSFPRGTRWSLPLLTDLLGAGPT